MITRKVEGIRAVKNGVTLSFYGKDALRKLQELGECEAVEFFTETRVITMEDFIKHSTVKEVN